jgi:lysophospholipase L1-like esterase
MHQTSGEASAAPRLSVVVLGDSLAYGLGASKEEHGLTQRVFAQLRADRPGSTFANHAVPHATMGDVLRHQVPKLRGAQADVVLLIAGANDLRYTHDRLVFARRFRHLLQEVRRAAPAARIVVGGMPDVTQTVAVPWFAKAAVSRVCRMFNGIMQRIAGDLAHGFVDLFAYTNKPLQTEIPYLCDDGYHPNDDGYAEIAQRSMPAILEVLRSLDTAPTAFPGDDSVEMRFRV